MISTCVCYRPIYPHANLTNCLFSRWLLYSYLGAEMSIPVSGHNLLSNWLIGLVFQRMFVLTSSRSEVEICSRFIIYQLHLLNTYSVANQGLGAEFIITIYSSLWRLKDNLSWDTKYEVTEHPHSVWQDRASKLRIRNQLQIKYELPVHDDVYCSEKISIQVPIFPQ